MDVAGSLVYFKHDDRENEKRNIDGCCDPAVDRVLVVQVLDVRVVVVKRLPLCLVDRQVISQRGRVYSEENSE